MVVLLVHDCVLLELEAASETLGVDMDCRNRKGPVLTDAHFNYMILHNPIWVALSWVLTHVLRADNIT